MEQCDVKGCMRAGQKHHIVFRSQGGLNIELNYISLCIYHHSVGKEAVHNNRAFDLELKRALQERYFELFEKEQYTIAEISELIGYNKNRLARRMKSVPQRAGKYGKEDIIRFLMGGKLY